MDSGFIDEVVSSNMRKKKEDLKRTPICRNLEKCLFFLFPEMTLLTNKTDSEMFMDDGAGRYIR
ncbi:hypothetical protein LEP1GSC090_2007 [Leptospira borgpetersenii serovar Javanica str. MK146]|nr:hypothetical protein LEP1GSC090_2007 [Leptospira borgpetersenii serovar Javanica str. MK146]